jgi:hypothetical protein
MVALLRPVEIDQEKLRRYDAGLVYLAGRVQKKMA